MNHEKYDTSKVKTITLNGKKYIDMSVIEDIKTELTSKAPRHTDGTIARYSYGFSLDDVLEIIDRKINEVTNGREIYKA